MNGCRVQVDTLSCLIVEKHSPVITKTIRENLDPPWMDAEYKLNRSKRRKLEKESKKNKEKRDAYVAQRKLCAEMVVNKQREHYSKIITEAGNDQKTLFKIANELLDKNKVRILPEHDDPAKLANEFNRYYTEKIEKIREAIPITSDDIIKPDVFVGDKKYQNIKLHIVTDIKRVIENANEQWHVVLS